LSSLFVNAQYYLGTINVSWEDDCGVVTQTDYYKISFKLYRYPSMSLVCSQEFGNYGWNITSASITPECLCYDAQAAYLVVITVTRYTQNSTVICSGQTGTFKTCEELQDDWDCKVELPS
jgi:hypothetical protein